MATLARWFAQSGGNLIARLWVPQQMGILLMKSTYVPDIDTQLRYSDIVAQELAAAGGYTTGGKEILGRTISYDAAGDKYDMIGNDVTWGPGATFTTRYGVVYEMATTDKYLWELLDFGADMPIVNGYFAVDFQTGVVSVRAAAGV